MSRLRANRNNVVASWLSAVCTGMPNGAGSPKYWDQNNVWVDGSDYLHLKLSARAGRWYCSEAYTRDRLGFGSYQFWVIGRVDYLDPNVVFGFFSYPTPNVGPDGTNEPYIEFAEWGTKRPEISDYTVWPTTPNLTSDHQGSR